MSTHYTPQTWADGDTTKPLSAARLSHLEDGIAAVDTALDATTATANNAASTAAAAQTTANGAATTATTAQTTAQQALTAAQAATGGTGAANPYATYLTPSGGDDTAVITAAISAAVSAAQTRGDNYAEVVFRPGTYLINSAPSGGASSTCNAQIPIDPIPEALQKVILVLRGTRDQSALYHWLQTTPQLAGVTLKSSYVGGKTPTTYSEPCVLGGPNAAGGYAFMGGPRFSNMHVVIDGINISVPQDPQVAGFDLRGIGEATVVSASVLARSVTTGAPIVPTTNSGLWAFGLAMPDTNNNDVCDIGHYSCEGMVIGVEMYEHVQASSLRLIKCYDGILFNSRSGAPHACIIEHASVEACFQAVANAAASAKFIINTLDIEWSGTSGHIVQDTGNTAVGTIRVRSNGTATALNGALSSGATAVNGAAKLRIVNEDQAAGTVTAPAVPATTVALVNPFWRDAAVSVSGGTVTGISVDGQALNVTSGVVFVPTGKSITLTYSTAPTWAWTLL